MYQHEGNYFQEKLIQPFQMGTTWRKVKLHLICLHGLFFRRGFSKYCVLNMIFTYYITYYIQFICMDFFFRRAFSKYCILNMIFTSLNHALIHRVEYMLLGGFKR